jgi:crotonobetainyl-CoA:carnitine CoA-transferase CaiB-like acyl-CoA transferase
MQQNILSGVKVLDLSRLLPGPYCSMMLADFGAEVINIEDKKFAAEPRFPTLMRGKKHMNLNLKKEKAREIFFELAKQSNVILDGFRPGVTKSLGVDYETVKQINPKIVYCSITGYGQDGPYSKMVGHDLNYIGFTGILEHNAPKDEDPVLPSVQIADIAGGSLMGVIGILLGLYEVQKTGEGKYIDISMMDGAFSNAVWLFSQLNMLGISPTREKKTILTGEYPFYGVYKCADDKYITLGAIEPRFWKIFCEHFDIPQYITSQYEAGDKKEEIENYLKNLFLKKTSEEWFKELKPLDICIGKVLTIEEALEDKHIKYRNLVVKAKNSKGKNVNVINQPIKISDLNSNADNKTIPDFGQHTKQVLTGLGYSDQEIAQFQNEGII